MKTKWVARDKDGSLWLFDTKPCLNEEGNGFKPRIFDEEAHQVFDDIFPEVTFENSPKEIIFRRQLLWA